MKNYRLFLLGFVTASFVFLTGFEKHHDSTPPAEKQIASIKEKKDQSNGKERHSKSKQKKTKKENPVPGDKNDVNENVEQKALDLSMPFKDSENAGLKIEQNRAAQGELLNMFSTEQKKQLQPVYLDSQMLMSQEPEMDKRKSLDGAGIVINLKR